MGLVFKPTLALITLSITAISALATYFVTLDPTEAALIGGIAGSVTQGLSQYASTIPAAPLVTPVKTSDTTAAIPTVTVVPTVAAVSSTIVTLPDGTKAVVPSASIQKVQG